MGILFLILLPFLSSDKIYVWVDNGIWVHNDYIFSMYMSRGKYVVIETHPNWIAIGCVLIVAIGVLVWLIL